MREAITALQAALRELEAAREASTDLHDLQPIIEALQGLLTSLSDEASDLNNEAQPA